MNGTKLFFSQIKKNQLCKLPNLANFLLREEKKLKQRLWWALNVAYALFLAKFN